MCLLALQALLMVTRVTTTEPPPAWSDVSAIASTDTNSGIFGKLTSMVRNVRWLYNKLGTTDFSNVGGGRSPERYPLFKMS